ncbi:MAG: helix-turn-helix transcriptional regulator [Lachnospiraceae bacterium]|nr:helix-turn-helix transcriptional regulator [Lachnospiraceae bacterium]
MDIIVVGIADRIKALRKNMDLSQEALADKLGITRSAVNAWEMGTSAPSTHMILELTSIFRVSSDYLLGLDETGTIDVSGLKAEDIEALHALVAYMRKKNENP